MWHLGPLRAPGALRPSVDMWAAALVTAFILVVTVVTLKLKRKQKVDVASQTMCNDNQSTSCTASMIWFAPRAGACYHIAKGCRTLNAARDVKALRRCQVCAGQEPEEP